MKALVPSLLIAGALHGGELVTEPFQPRSEAEGKTLFTELASERTGVVTTNRYDDPRMWAERHSEYNVGAIGTGVAVGDFDGDGRPDLFVVSKIESGRLFRNLGEWKFEDVTAVAGVEDGSGEWKQGASFVDVDNDGLLDLYVCRFGAPNQLYMNQGDGTFRDEAKERGLAVVDSSGGASFADYDRDGWLDVFIQTNLLDAVASIEGQRDFLFRNNGDGTFRDVTEAAGILEQATQGHSATWWDQNEDGWLDLYIANDFAPPDFLYRNNKDGTFSNAIDHALPHTPFSSMGSDIGDLNKDGHIDLFVADMAGTDHEFTQRGIADTRAMLDPAQNERLDAAVQIHLNSLYLNTGTDRSMEAAHLAGLPGTNWTWSPRFEDLNSDGLLDLFVTNGMDREHNNLDFIVKKLRAVNVFGRIRITKISPVLAQANLAYVNRGELVFEEVGAEWGLDKVGVSFGSALGDFDGDGDLDIVFTNYEEGATILRNDSRSGNNVIIELKGTASNRFGLGARVEATTKSGLQVRQLISTRGYLSTSEPVVHFGFGTEETIDSLRIVWPSGREQVLKDLSTGQRYKVTEPDTDGLVEISPEEETRPQFVEVTEAMGLGVTQREEVLEGTVSQPLLHRRFNRRGPGLAVGDLDGDGMDEIVKGATAVDGPKIFKRAGEAYQMLNTGALGKAPSINDGPPLIFDANGDGANDLLFTAGGAALPAEEPEYESRLWLSDGRGGFSRAPEGFLPSLPISVGAAVAADFDRDGRLDLFLGGRLFPGYYPEPAYSALLLQEKGRMKDATNGFAPDLAEVGLVTSALATDVDGDGWIDLVVALEWGGVRFFRNVAGGSLEDVSEDWGFDTTGPGMWKSIVAADFNQDGRMDYALGNQGMNTFYSATREHPMKLFVNDFSGSGEPQLVLSYNVEGVLYPVASRGELASKIPAVMKRFPSNDAFSAATLGEILGEEALADAEVYEAGELRSGVLLSQPTGGFVFKPLPRLAQISPTQGMAAADFDGDGKSDLLLVNNDYSSIPAQGRFDSGLGCLLYGNGAGDFEVASIEESGWLVTGNPKALALVDFNGDARPDAVVSRNNQSMMAFGNLAQEGMRSIAVRLRGKGGNPDGIGARVALVSGEDVVQLSEVQAGGGFASQSTATLFFSVPSEPMDSLELRVRWASGESAEVELNEKSGYVEISE
ncbi:FG-GAP repeat domain protein [Verrucomicrobiia bacterium DG1235]|nr:FG-GAP repeat domain protein [Verrucomicrobiae bacterium DG1235]